MSEEAQKQTKERRLSLDEAIMMCNESLKYELKNDDDDEDGWGSEDSQKYVNGTREFLTSKQRVEMGKELEPLMTLSDDGKKVKETSTVQKKKNEKPKWKPPTGGVQVMMLPPKMLKHKKRGGKKKKTHNYTENRAKNVDGIKPMLDTIRHVEQKGKWRSVSLGSEGFRMTRDEDTFYINEDTGETKWNVPSGESDKKNKEKDSPKDITAIDHSTMSSSSSIEKLTNSNAEIDRKTFSSSEEKQTIELEKRVYTLLSSLNLFPEMMDSNMIESHAKILVSYFGIHISADTRQFTGHLLGTLVRVEDSVMRSKVVETVLSLIKIESLWDQYEQFVRETEVLYVE